MSLRQATVLPPELTISGKQQNWKCVYRLSYRASSTLATLPQRESATVLEILTRSVQTIGGIVDGSLHQLLQKPQSQKPFETLQGCITARENVTLRLRELFGGIDCKRGEMSGYRMGEISKRYEFTFAPQDRDWNWLARFTFSPMATAGLVLIPIFSNKVIPQGTQEIYCRLLCNEGTALFATIDHCLARLTRVVPQRRLETRHLVANTISHLTLLR